MRQNKLQEDFVANINAHRGILIKICNSYTINREDKTDLYQEILYQIWSSYPAFRNESKISTWIYRIALNTAITWIKSDKKNSLSTHLYEEIFLDNKEDDMIKKLYEGINQLNKTDKAFILLYLDDYSYKEISEIMGISLSNTGVKLTRIKEKLEKIINQSEEFKTQDCYESR